MVTDVFPSPTPSSVLTCTPIFRVRPVDKDSEGIAQAYHLTVVFALPTQPQDPALLAAVAANPPGIIDLPDPWGGPARLEWEGPQVRQTLLVSGFPVTNTPEQIAQLVQAVSAQGPAVLPVGTTVENAHPITYAPVSGKRMIVGGAAALAVLLPPGCSLLRQQETVRLVDPDTSSLTLDIRISPERLPPPPQAPPSLPAFKPPPSKSKAPPSSGPAKPRPVGRPPPVAAAGSKPADGPTTKEGGVPASEGRKKRGRTPSPNSRIADATHPNSAPGSRPDRVNSPQNPHTQNPPPTSPPQNRFALPPGSAAVLAAEGLGDMVDDIDNDPALLALLQAADADPLEE
jgi:hypothetical protein